MPPTLRTATTNTSARWVAALVEQIGEVKQVQKKLASQQQALELKEHEARKNFEKILGEQQTQTNLQLQQLMTQMGTLAAIAQGPLHCILAVGRDDE